MKTRLVVLSVLATMAVFIGTASAIEMDLYVDAAPNVYGSPNWTPWWEQTRADVVNGTFTDMRSTDNPGTTLLDPYDEIVYSTGDLGTRLHWIYWLPDQTIAGLDGKFEVKWVIDWGGDEWTYEGGGWAANGAEVGWSQPSSWEAYDGGVIGSLGFAWWATDNDAPPLGTDGDPYNQTTPADVAALRQDVLQFQTFATGMIRYHDESGDWQTQEITLQVVPEPISMLMLGALGAGMAAARKLRRRKA